MQGYYIHIADAALLVLMQQSFSRERTKHFPVTKGQTIENRVFDMNLRLS